MTDPLGDAGAMAQAQVRAVVANASALGLTWTRRLATVTGYDGTVLMATLDGDTVPVAVTSMNGGTLVAGQRAYVDIVPPAGNYVVGLVTMDWVTPTLLNSWVDYGAGFQGARFRRLATGQVEIQGLVKNGTGPASVVFTLPSGYRPAATLLFATIANNAIARFDIDSAGSVTWQAGGTNAFLSLNCVFYPG